MYTAVVGILLGFGEVGTEFNGERRFSLGFGEVGPEFNGVRRCSLGVGDVI